MAVEYCPICGLPFEYCRFGPQPKNCKENLRLIRPQLFARLYPDDVHEEAPAPEAPHTDREQHEQAEEDESGYDTSGSEESGSESESDAELEPARIVVPVASKAKRNRPAVLVLRMRGTKKVTDLQYLSVWGIDFNEACRDLKKSCQAAVSVVEDTTLGRGFTTIIRIQGDFRTNARAYLVSKGIPDNQVSDGGTAVLHGHKKPRRQPTERPRIEMPSKGGRPGGHGQGQGQGQGQGDGHARGPGQGQARGGTQQRTGRPPKHA